LTFDIKNILLISGSVIYIVKYIIGWLLYFKNISMTKRTHQVFFAAIIINLSLLVFFLQFLSPGFFLCAASLTAMLILPFGRKGGVYHRVISTAGLLLYSAILIL
jgi:hypothetical protein